MAGSGFSRRTLLVLGTLTGTGLFGSSGASATTIAAAPQAGTFELIYDPSVGEPQPWYINDHCFTRDANGMWHLFGITHPEPAAPEDEHLFAHATASTLHGPWTKHPPALEVDPHYGETHLWAPHVVEVEGLHYMFYAGGGDDRSTAAINLATSRDLFHWTRHDGGPLFQDGFDARDPFVLRVDDQWVCYYTANAEPTGGHHVVAYRTSDDLIEWGPRQIAFTSDRVGTSGGDTESPFITWHDGAYYLFVGPCGAYDEDRPDGYTCTTVYRSTDPYHFPIGSEVSRIPSHAPEIVEESGSWWISHAGWGQGGVHLAPLSWNH